jgi:hypothetical protein
VVEKKSCCSLAAHPLGERNLQGPVKPLLLLLLLLVLWFGQ